MNVSLADFYLYTAYLLIVLGITACLYSIIILPMLIGITASNIFCNTVARMITGENRPTGISAKFLSFTGVL